MISSASCRLRVTSHSARKSAAWCSRKNGSNSRGDRPESVAVAAGARSSIGGMDAQHGPDRLRESRKFRRRPGSAYHAAERVSPLLPWGFEMAEDRTAALAHV